MEVAEEWFRLRLHFVCFSMFTSTQLERSIVALEKSDSLAAIESSADLTAVGYGDIIRLPLNQLNVRLQ